MDRATGKERRPCPGFETKAKGEEFAFDLQTQSRQGQYRGESEDVTLKDFCKSFLGARPDLQPGSVEVYKNTEQRLLNYFGKGCLLTTITPQRAEMFIANLKRLEDPDGDLSAWSRSRALRNCKTMFKMAATWELIARNPFEKVQRPKCRVQPWHYLTPDDFMALLNASNGRQTVTLRQKAIYSLGYCCGLRKGEFVSLMWTDIDFAAATVTIQDRPATGKHPPFFVKDAESRTVPIPQHCLAILHDLSEVNDLTDKTPFVALDESQYKTLLSKWKRYKAEKRAWQNKDWQNNTLDTFKLRVRWAGIEPKGTLSLHTLRKSCITNWANNIKNPETVRKLAGHADLATTMKYYSQVTPDQLQQAAAVVDTLLSKMDVKWT
ncbi:MAG: site-specific integrase [Phycisphaerae bacterium]|nr:site-specific integrase [Phycisphaerae bacterium]